MLVAVRVADGKVSFQTLVVLHRWSFGRVTVVDGVVDGGVVDGLVHFLLFGFLTSLADLYGFWLLFCMFCCRS